MFTNYNYIKFPWGTYNSIDGKNIDIVSTDQIPWVDYAVDAPGFFSIIGEINGNHATLVSKKSGRGKIFFQKKYDKYFIRAKFS